MASPKEVKTVKPLKAKADPLADAIKSLVSDIPPRMAGDLVSAFSERGFSDVESIKAEDSKTAIYRLGSAVRSVIRVHSVMFYESAIKKQIAPSSNEFVVNGIDVKTIYPNCKVSFVKRFRVCLEQQKLKELKNMAHRSAPPLIEIALHDSVRSMDDIGLDGQYLYDALVK